MSAQAIAEQPVSEIASRIPGATRLFRENRINFCCRGELSLSQAARERDLDPASLADTLARMVPNDPAVQPEETAALIAHIQKRYHDTFRAEIPELIVLSHKVERVHRDNPHVPAGLADTLAGLSAEMELHMQKEEGMLFPSMINGDAAVLGGPLNMMEAEHREHAALIERIIDLTDNFTVPEGACRSWQILYHLGAKLTDDLMEHIHLENNILFPRFR